MAKPGFLVPWATNANYAGGPFPATPTKVAVPAGVIADGWQPDQKPPAEYQNQWQSDVAAWVSWVNDGVATPDETAHLIETDSSGRATIAQGFFGPLIADLSPVVQITPLAGGSAIGLDVSGTGIRPGILADGGDTAGPCVEAVLTKAGNTGPAILGRRTASAGDGVEGRGRDGGRGVYGEADQSAGTGHGVEGLGGDSSGAGVRGEAQTSAFAGVEGTNTNTNGTGVKGTTVALASSSAFAVQGLTGTGDATAVQGRSDSGDGYAGFFFADASSPIRAALRLVPQDANPSTAGPGDIHANNDAANERDVLRFRGTAVWETILTNLKGFAWAWDTDATQTNNNSAAYTTACTAVIAAAGASAPNETGVVWVLAWGGIKNDGGTLNTCDLRVRDTTAVADLLTEQMALDKAGPTVTEKTFARFMAYALPSVGVSRNIELQFKKNAGAGTGIEMVNSGLLILGVF